MRKVGILTGGGDCPGLNPAIRAIVRTASRLGWSVIGFRYGWKGMLKNDSQELTLAGVDDLLSRGGTILRTSRTNPYKEENGPAKVTETFQKSGIDALIAIGGEDTVGVAAKLSREGLKIVGLPKTIDNDLDVTDFTLGFETAVQIVSDAFDRLRTTAESHDRILVVEIMGRHAGWLATYGGLAGGADVTLVPEFPMAVREVCTSLESCRKRGKNYAIIGVAEGAKVLDDDGREIDMQSKEAVDAFGHVQLGGIGELLAKLIKKRTGYDTRAVNLGHLQRGGTPTAFDRILSTAFGVRAMELVHEGAFGKMPALVNGKIATVSLDDAVGKLKTLSPEFYAFAKGLFG